MRNQDARAAEAAKQAHRQTAAAPVWSQAADDFLMKRYSVPDPMTGKTMVDGSGMAFAKQLALAQAMRNGGDTTSALGFAFEIDNQIARENGSDQAKINAARTALLQRMFAAKPQTATQK